MPTYFPPLRELNQKRSTKYLFLAEGDAEVGFAEAVLTKLAVDPAEATIVCFQGVSKLIDKTRTFAKILAPTEENLNNLKGICLLADSDDNPAGRLDTIIECAKALGFARSAQDLRGAGVHQSGDRRFSVALAPAASQQGRIEHLVLAEALDNSTHQCLQDLVTCYAGVTGGGLDQKAQAQIYISMITNNSMAGIGRAFKAGFLNVDHQAYLGHVAAMRHALFM